jgi:hypothetical protein
MALESAASPSRFNSNAWDNRNSDCSAYGSSVMIEMVDSLTSPQTTGSPIPADVMNAEVVAGYEAGNSWPTFVPYCEARPDLARKGWVVSITLTALGHARAYDIEPGGGSNQNIGIFMSNAVKSEGLPWLYTFASNGQAMMDSAVRFGFHQGKDYYYWSSHVGRGKHICAPDVCGFPRADGTQYEFDTLIDRSTLNDYMLPQKATPIDPLGMFYTNLPANLPNHGNERLTVEQARGALEHPLKYRDYLKGVVYGELKAYRDHIWTVAHYEPPAYTRKRKDVQWGIDHRGSRWQYENNLMKKIAAIP